MERRGIDLGLSPYLRLPGEGRGPYGARARGVSWIPAFAGKTGDKGLGHACWGKKVPTFEPARMVDFAFALIEQRLSGEMGAEARMAFPSGGLTCRLRPPFSGKVRLLGMG